PKPAVTRALVALVRAGLARRQRPEGDRRQVIVHRTVAGSTRLRELGDRFASSLEGASPFDALRVRSEPRMPSKQEPRHV
ncbi:MAG: hypothetical protein HXY25_03125, partial [Alphaproteobacteria bacterium]|nr:hypothetical protein [Alphaproteobacteria bacterium]